MSERKFGRKNNVVNFKAYKQVKERTSASVDGTSIRDWYMDKFPHDDLASELYSHATFEELYEVMSIGVDPYDYFGVGDSIIRENIFHGMVEVLGVDIDKVYEYWIEVAIKD